MKHHERQQRAWQKIKFTTKRRGVEGVSRLGIPVGFEEATTQEIWDYLQQQ